MPPPPPRASCKVGACGRFSDGRRTSCFDDNIILYLVRVSDDYNRSTSYTCAHLLLSKSKRIGERRTGRGGQRESTFGLDKTRRARFFHIIMPSGGAAWPYRTDADRFVGRKV